MMPEKFNKKIMILFQCMLIVLTLTGCVSQASRFGIIFTSGQFGSLDIFRITDNTQNNAVEQLTYTPTVGEYNLLVSKNGDQIVFEVGFTSLMEDSSESKMEEYQHIYLLDATDKTFVDITKTLVGYETVWRNFSIDWFPNQNQFVFIANEVADSEIKSFIKFVDVDKGSREDIVISITDEIPSAFNSVKWSPDGRKLLLTRGVIGGAQLLQNPGSAILVYDLESKITTQITNMKDQCLPKGWSPTAKQIVATCSLSVPYVEGVSMPETVRVFNVENPDQPNELLTFSNCYDPSWSSDGSQIVFVCDKGENQMGLFVVNSDGSGIHEVKLGSAINTIVLKNPKWSPDGTQIVFVAGTDSEHTNIYSVHLDGSNNIQLTNQEAFYNIIVVYEVP
jgi:Tol biopolymer transport system component